MIRLLLLLVALGAGLSAIFMFATRPTVTPEPVIVAVPEDVTGGDLTAPEIIPEPIVEREVLVAAIPIAPGERLTPDSLEWISIPEDAVVEGMIALEEDPDAISQVVTQVSSNFLDPGEPIRRDRLRNPPPATLSQRLATGAQAVSIPIRPENAAGGFVLPGDFVDVLLVRSGEQRQSAPQVVVSNVRVLAVDQFTVEDFEGNSIVSSTTTLELSPAQTQAVATARTAQGELIVALRAGESPDEQVEIRDVLVATRNISAGERFAADDLIWQPMPINMIDSGFILQDGQPDTIERLLDMVSLSYLDAGMPLRSDRIRSAMPSNLAMRIPSGKRAISIQVSPVSAAGGFILPEDQVDVLKLGDSGGGTTNAQLIISNVRVLAMDQTTREDLDGKTILSTIATLELSAEQAQIVLSAQGQIVQQANASDDDSNTGPASEQIRDGGTNQSGGSDLLVLALRSPEDREEPQEIYRPAVPSTQLIRIIRNGSLEEVEVPR